MTMTTLMWVALKGVGILLGASFVSLLTRRASASLRHLIWTTALVAVLTLPALEASGLRVEIPVPVGWLAEPDLTAVTAAVPAGLPSAARRAGAIESGRSASAATGPGATRVPKAEAVVPPHETVVPPPPPHRAERSLRLAPVLERGDLPGAVQGRAGNERAVPISTAERAELPAGGSHTATVSIAPSPIPWTTLLTVVWALGALLLLSATLFNHLAAYRLTRRDVWPMPQRTQRRADELAYEVGIADRVRVVRSSVIRVPATWMSTIVLPEHYTTWSPARLERVLLHELAHVRRRDCLTHLLGELTRALHWPNPLVWLAVQYQRRESERACDDQVLAHGDVPTDYAEDLVGLVRALRADNRVPGAALAMAGQSGVGDRVRAILDPVQSRGRVGRVGAFVGGALAMAVAFSITGFVPVAQERPSLPPPPPPNVVAANVPDVPLPSVDLSLSPVEIPLPPGVPSTIGVGDALPVPSAQPGLVPLGGLDVLTVDVQQSQELCVFRRGGPRSTSYHTDDDASRIRWEADDCRVEIDLEGHVEFATDDSEIVFMAPGALFEVEERIGRDSRRARFDGESGGRIERRYWVDGDGVPWGTEADRWIAHILPQLFRHTTINAAARVERMLDEGGPARVFAEVEQIFSDHVATRYLELLMEQAELDEAEYARVIEFTADIESDHNSAMLLLAVVEEAGLRPAFQEPMLRAADGLESDHQKAQVLQALLASDLTSGQLDAVVRTARDIDSDHNLAQVLSTVAREGRLSDAGRESFMQTLESIDSDHQHAMVLGAFLDSGPLTTAELTQVLAMTRGIDSDHQRAMILQRVAREYPLTGAQVTAYLRAASEIESDHQLAATAEEIINRAEFDADQLRLVLAIADDIDSDHQRSMVLMSVIGRRELTPSEVEAVLDVAVGIGSDHQLSQTLLLLATDEDLDEDGVYGVIAAAGEIGSDHNRAMVLMGVADNHGVRGEARSLYIELAEEMSRHQRDQALARIVR